MQTDELYELTDDLLNSKQQVKLKVGGYSMFPFLRKGDEIIINKCHISELKIGDVVIFKKSDKWIAHRLHKLITDNNNKTLLITKGDSCRAKDLPVTVENFAGKVISFIRNGKERKLESNHYIKTNRSIVRFSVPLTLFILPILWFIIVFKKTIKSIKDIKNSLLFICRESKRLAIVNMIISILQGILPFVIIYLFKWMIDAISKINGYADKTKSFHDILIIIIITGCAFLISAILNILSGEFRERLSQSISVYVYRLMQQKHIKLDMAYLEDARQQDKIHRAVTEAGFRPLKMINESYTAIQSMISWIVIAVILLRIHWIIFILIFIAALPGFWVRFRFSNKLYKLNKANSTKERELYYYNRILTSLPFAKEIRLFGTGAFFTERFRNIQTYLNKQRNVILRKHAIADILAQTFAVIFTFVSFGYITHLAVDGTILIGTVVLFFLVFQRGFSAMNSFFQSIAGLYEDNVFLSDFFDFLKLPALQKSSLIPEKIIPLQHSIIIDNVSFQYPSSQRKALDSISIEIPAGKTVALVGPNGSGKTTLVKLLCGFYLPDKGKILFDNKDISCINPESIRENITAVFQDFVLYNMKAAENIYLGDITNPSLTDKIKQAAENAGIADILESLPLGFDNMIGNLFENSEELSIGQWQKMAIARAFYRNSPILFMDEPSSALDAETELHLLQNLKSLAKEKTVLIISHRFSTIKWADIIYVLDNGRVIESGNHEQLMSNRGKYFNMFELNRVV